MAESFVEQMARLRAHGKPEQLPKPFPPHPVHGELEQLIVCVRCGAPVLVGPCFDHFDESFVCGGCLTRAGEVETVDPGSLSDATGQGRTGPRSVSVDGEA